jgi:hypothetical protein
MAQSLLLLDLSLDRMGRTLDRRQDLREEWILWLALASCCLCFATATSAQAILAELPNKDKQVWPELDTYFKAGARLDLTLISQVRLSKTLPNPDIWVVGVDANVTVMRHLLVTPSYYYYQFDQASGTLGQGQNAILATTIEETMRAYSFDDRSRIVGVISPSGNFWVYGNRARIEHKIGFESSRDFWFGWDELFYFSNTEAWQRNRVAVGVHKAFGERIAIEPYYLRQTDGHSRPGDLNTFGVTFDVRAR